MGQPQKPVGFSILARSGAFSSSLCLCLPVVGKWEAVQTRDKAARHFPIQLSYCICLFKKEAGVPVIKQDFCSDSLLNALLHSGRASLNPLRKALSSLSDCTVWKAVFPVKQDVVRIWSLGMIHGEIWQCWEVSISQCLDSVFSWKESTIVLLLYYR